MAKDNFLPSDLIAQQQAERMARLSPFSADRAIFQRLAREANERMRGRTGTAGKDDPRR